MATLPRILWLFKNFPCDLVDGQALRRHFFGLRVDRFLAHGRHSIRFRHGDIDADAIFLHGLYHGSLPLLQQKSIEKDRPRVGVRRFIDEHDGVGARIGRNQPR